MGRSASWELHLVTNITLETRDRFNIFREGCRQTQNLLTDVSGGLQRCNLQCAVRSAAGSELYEDDKLAITKNKIKKRAFLSSCSARALVINKKLSADPHTHFYRGVWVYQATHLAHRATH